MDDGGFEAERRARQQAELVEWQTNQLWVRVMVVLLLVEMLPTLALAFSVSRSLGTGKHGLGALIAGIIALVVVFGLGLGGILAVKQIGTRTARIAGAAVLVPLFAFPAVLLAVASLGT